MPQAVQGEITKDLLNGIGITCLIFAAAVYLPIIGFFGFMLLPLPILFYRSKLGRKNGMVIPVVVAIGMIVISGNLTLDIYFFIGSMFIGFALGECFEKHLSIEKIILYACGVVLAAYMVILIFYSNITNIGIMPMISGYVARNLEISIELYREIGMKEENIQTILDSMESFQYVLVRIIPAMVIVLNIIMTWVNILIARPVFKNKNLLYPDIGTLNRWKAPEPLVWAVIGCGLLFIFPGDALKMTGLNCLIVLMLIYFFQGIAIVSFYFEKKRFPRMLRIFLYSLMAVYQFMILFVIGIGFFDLWLNFRRLGIDEAKQE